MKLKKGDKVKVIKGEDRGKVGMIEKVFAKKARVLLPGLNVDKKHLKPRKRGDKGGIITIARPLAVAKVALICPECKKPTRVGFQLVKEEKRRICKECGQGI